jgi:hypothetical protein
VRFKLPFTVWIELLLENYRHIHPSKLGRAAAITAASPLFSALSLLQEALFRDEIASVKLRDDPIFVIGHWRSGTTLLHELLCLDTRLAYPDTSACMNPSQFLIDGVGTRTFAKRGSPVKRPMDNMTVSATSPQEDEFALFALGAPSPYMHWMFPADLKAHSEYFDLKGLSPRRLEQWKSIFRSFVTRVAVKKPDRLVLKSPTHSFRVGVLSEMFPRSVFVHIVRNPYVLFPSTRLLLTRMFELYGLTQYESAELEEYVLRTGQRMHVSLSSAIPDLGPNRFHRVRYEDLVTHPVDEMTLLYDRLKLGPIEPVLPALENYLQAHTGYETNKFELTCDEERRISERWHDMIQQYGYDPRTS